MYRAAADVRGASWVGAGLHGFGESVLSVVPDGFSEYVRVFHPAHRSVGSQRAAVTWAEIAAANGMRMHAGVQLGSITGSETYESQGQPGVFDQPPMNGTLPGELLDPLLAVLASHTSTPGGPAGSTALSPACRIEAVRELTDEVPLGGPGSPNLWWPEDHAWCVATEIDLKTTYIGADRACAKELIAVPGIEASPVSPDLGIDWLSDTLNPPQASA